MVVFFEWTSNDLRKLFLMPNQKAEERERERKIPKLRWEDGVDNSGENNLGKPSQG
jgi:hypothetical protein